MTMVSIVAFLTGIYFIINNQAATVYTIYSGQGSIEKICTRQSSGSFTFFVKMCKNVIVWLNPSFKIKIGMMNDSLICNITQTGRDACSDDNSPNNPNCGQFSNFIISWNSTYISLWKVVSSQSELILDTTMNNIYVEYITLPSYSVKWGFNTTWNINPDFTCVIPTTDSPTTFEDTTDNLSNDVTTSATPRSKFYETFLKNTTPRESTDESSGTDQSPTSSENLEISNQSSDQSSQTTSLPYLDWLKCRCPCAAISQHNPFVYLLGKNLSTEELIKQMRWRLDEIKASLVINKTDTTQYKSKKISIYDNRDSSSTIGWFGGIILASVVLILVAIDLLRVFPFFTKVKTDAHIRKKKKRKRMKHVTRAT